MRIPDSTTKERISNLTRKFFEVERSHDGRCLITSLYALREDADERTVELSQAKSWIVDLNQFFDKSDIDLLLEHFEYVLKTYYCYLNTSIVVVEPTDMDEIIASLLTTHSSKVQSIFIPYLGLNYIIQQGTSKDNKIDFIIDEHVEPILKIAQNTLSLDNVNAISFGVSDYIDSAADNHKKYNQIIVIPAFYEHPSGFHRYPENLPEEAIDMLSKLLKEEGQMALLLKEDVCTARRWRKFREFLVSNNNIFETTITYLPISNCKEETNACLFLIKKRKQAGFSIPLCIGNLTDTRFRIPENEGSFTLDTHGISKHMFDKDPQFFIRLNSRELNEGYDISPLHYQISDDYRLKALVDNYLRLRLFDKRERSARTLISSLYLHTSDAKEDYIEALHPLLQNLKEEMSIDNVAFLVERFGLVVDYCFKKDTGLSENINFNKRYSDIINSLLDEVDLPENPNCLLPFGNIQLSSIFPKSAFHCIESQRSDWAIGNIINSTLQLGGYIFDNESYYDPNVGFPHKLYGRVIAIPSIKQADIPSLIEEIYKCIEHKLGFGGKMAILLPRESCYAPNWEKLRWYLTQGCHDITLSVISLNIPSSSSVFNEESLYIVEKHLVPDYKPLYGKVALFDIDKKDFMIADDEVGVYDIKVDAIVDAIKNQDAKFAKIISINDLDEGINLLAARYFRNDYITGDNWEGKEITFLKDIISIIPTYNIWDKAIAHNIVDNDGASYKAYPNIGDAKELTISIQDLTENYLDCDIRVNKIKENSTTDARYTTDNGGYIAFSNGKIFIGKIDNIKDSIIGIEERICHFQVDPTKASLDYILKVLSTQEYVTEQVKCLTKGYTWTDEYLHPEDLLQIGIELPSLKIQQNEILADSQKGYADKVQELEIAFNEFKEDMHLKKHAIGQTIFSINNWMKLLKLARKRGEGIVKDSDVIGKNHPHSVLEIYENLEATMKRLQIQISKMDTGYEMVPVSIGITKFINDFISKHPRSEFEYINLVNWAADKDIPVVNIDGNDNIIGVSTTEFVLRKGDDLHEIYFPIEALELILENIISNACSHGFAEAEKAYKIKISGELTGKYLSIYVSNNGAPIHKDFSTTDVFKYAKSTSDAISGHHGTGGYEVWKLMKQFGGSAEFISTPDEEYTVTYKLTFQISNIIGTL